MVNFVLFIDLLRQEEIDLFYKACQMQREYYRGYPKAFHPLAYFNDWNYKYQCPPEMSSVYLGYPSFHTRYKQPVMLPVSTETTSGFPPLPDRSLAGRYNKDACKAFSR